MTVVSDYTAILSGSYLNDAARQGAFYTFSFLASVPAHYASLYSPAALATFRPFTEAERQTARQALEAWASASGLTFFEVPAGEGDIVFGSYDMELMGFGWFTGYAFYPAGRFDNPIKSDIFFERDTSPGLQLMLHEVGHALGLKHPHGDDPTLNDQYDNYSYTVMSYKSGGFSGQSLGAFDVEAIQYLYGAPGADGTQVTSWSWDPASYTLSQTGGAAIDSIFGVGTADIIAGLGGNDFIQGRGGGDQLNGGGGDDEILGGGGDDRIEGGGGSDTLHGNAGADRFVYSAVGDSTSSAQDRLVAFETGIDKIDLGALAVIDVSWTQSPSPNPPGVQSLVTVTTGAGTMTLLVEGQVSQSDFILTPAPPGPIVGSPGNDVLQGTGGADTIRGEGGEDILYGQSGNDMLDGGAGVDRMAGGPGDDSYTVGEGGDIIEESVDSGTDLAISSVSYVLAANVENLILTGSAAIDAVGNGLINILTGNDGANLLNGGLGADQMAGGLGGDVYFIADPGDSVTEAVNAGTDEVRTSLADTVAAANVETLTGLLNSGQTLRGNGLANLFAGGTGADRFVGGPGNDVYLVAAGDIVVEKAGEGTDEVRTALAAYTLTADVERLAGTAATGQVLTGNALANTIQGGAGNDRLDGGGGADQLAGGLGNDIYYLDHPGDVVTEAAAAGTDEIRTGLSDTMASANVETITGLLNTGQTLRGNGLGNLISGGTGADRMVGGLGDDIYVVGAGDNVIEKAGEGTDEVRTALASYALTAEVERLTGTSAAQALTGNALANLLTGGAGADTLAGGGGADAFRYLAVTDSNTPGRDHILDFTPGTDKIDLAAIDASRALGGDQAFAWIGSSAFSKTAGELRAFQSGGQWIVQGDINGDGFADLVIALTLQGPNPLGAGDFQL